MLDTTRPLETWPVRGDAPQAIQLPLGSGHLMIVLHAGRALHPPEGLLALRGFLREAGDGNRRWLSAAQAADGRWGLLVVDDGGCHWRMPPHWDNAFNPTEGLLRFREHERWGCCDPHGRILIEPRHAAMRPFAGGRAAVRAGDGQWHWIDAQGRRVGDATFAQLYCLDRQGYARAECLAQTGRFGFVDGEGHWRIAPHFRHLRPFGPGDTAPATEDGERWGLIDRQGAWVLPPCHRHIAAFNDDGLAHFCPQGSLWDIRHGYLDARGGVAIAPEQHISEDMACGIAAAHYEGSRYVRADGSALSAPALSFGTAFRACGDGIGYAIARSGQAPAVWGLLHSDGHFAPAPADLLEPWTDWESSIPDPPPGSACIPFLTEDAGIAWLHPMHGVRWRARYGAEGVTLQDAQGRTLWHGAAAQDHGAPRRFFNAPAEQHLECLRAPHEAPALAEALLAQARLRLRDYAAGQILQRDAEENKEEDEADEEEDEADEDGDADDPQQIRTHARRRIFRAYLSDELMQSYVFLEDHYATQARLMHDALGAAITAYFGHTDAIQAEFIQPQRYPPHHPPAWRVADGWLALYAHHGTGDGDAWWELWLHAAPTADALQRAVKARANPGSN